MQVINIKEKDGGTTEYVRDHNGVIKQLYPKRFVYDANYCATYDTPGYERKSQALQRLRLGFVEACSPGEINTLLDCGYGNGAFLKYVEITKTTDRLFGYDVSGLPVPPRCEKLKELPIRCDAGGMETIDVITFWDCLEHFPDLSFIADLDAKMIAVSLPWCPYNYWLGNKETWNDRAVQKFTEWHHRKPDEHLYHFDKESLIATFSQYGWKCVATTSIEDAVRKGKGKHPTLPNILTAAFVRK